MGILKLQFLYFIARLFLPTDRLPSQPQCRTTTPTRTATRTRTATAPTRTRTRTVTRTRTATATAATATTTRRVHVTPCAAAHAAAPPLRAARTGLGAVPRPAK